MGILSSGPALSVVNTTLIYRRLHSTRRFPCIQGEKGTAIPVSEGRTRTTLSLARVTQLVSGRPQSFASYSRSDIL